MIRVPSPILCRPAGQADTLQALSLASEIWGGDDYVPQVWESWLEDATGLLAVAVWQGRVVGIGHLADLGWGEAWLEGLRVAPDLQGRGIGSILHDYLVGRWLAGRSPVVRLLTHEHREAVKAMCARSGFEPVARMHFRTGKALQGTHAFVKVGNDDSHALSSLVREGTVRLGGGLMDLGWELAELTSERLRHTPGLSVWSWRSGQGWLVTRREAANPDPEMTLSAASGEPLSELLSDVRCLADDLGVEEVHWLAPESAPIQASLEAAGFEAADASEILLAFERRR